MWPIPDRLACDRGAKRKTVRGCPHSDCLTGGINVLGCRRGSTASSLRLGSIYAPQRKTRE